MVDPTSTKPTAPIAFERRLAQIVVVAIMGLLLWRLAGVLLLAFAALIVALALIALSSAMRRLAPLPRRIAIALSALLLFGALAGVIGFYGWRIAGQYEVIFAKARQGAQFAMNFLQAHDWSRYILQKARGAQIADATDFLAPRLGSLVSGVGRYVTYGVIVIVCGLLLALDPQRYQREFLALVPPAHRPVVGGFLVRTGNTLRLWLVSRLIVMGAIGVLSSIGLLLLGIPAALTLGFTGALLTFIPYLGALLAAVPAILVAFTASPVLAVATGLMYWGVHFIEGTFITPLVQDKQVSMSPVLTIVGTLAFGVIFGPSGMLLASPLMIVVLMAIQVFYVEAVLGQKADASASGSSHSPGDAFVAPAADPAGQA